tara:strand:- start:23130 stop:25148 length:2019 start_codon:yes stop_codon:yes gene_type:complete
MSGIVYKLSKQCSKAFIKTQVDLFAEHFLAAGELETLLTEALDDKDKQEFSAALDQAISIMNQISDATPDTPEWKALVDALNASAPDIGGAEIIYDADGDPKKRAEVAAEYTKSTQDMMGEAAALIQCIETVKGEIGKSKVEDGTKTVGDLANAAAEGGDDAPDFPTPDDLKKAVEKTYVVPDWYNKAWESGSKEAEAESGGFFKKVMGFIGKLFGGDDSGNIVADDMVLAAIMSSPFEEFAAINLQKLQQELVGVTEDIGAETAEASAAAAQAQGGADAAASATADMKAAAQGAEVLKKNPDVAKNTFTAAKEVLEPSDAAAVEAGMAGKLDALTPRQQQIVALILQLFGSGPDAASPEQVADVADKADDAADEEVAKDFKNLAALADLGTKHLGDGGDELVKNMLSDEEASKVFAAHYSRPGAAIHESTLLNLLFEEEEGIPFEDVVTAFSTAGKATGLEPGEEEITAWATDVNDQGLLDKAIAIAGEEGGEEGEEGAPASEEEAAEEQETAQAELESAAQEAAAEEAPPAVAVAAALDNWMGGLSKSSQQSLAAKDRIGGLKDLVNTALEDAAKAIEGEVEAAIDIWRGEHEETLMKSKRFAKKNFDSLSQLIPQIAAQMLKVTAENNVRLTRGMVRKTVYRHLDRKFGRHGMLIESTRWEALAGIRSK